MNGPSALPRFHDASRRIAARIEAGELLAGDRLPSERLLVDELGVSRTTVRRAIRELVDQGLLEASPRGAYVTRARDLPANRLMSLTELAHSRGLRASARVLSSEVRPASLDEAECFQIAPGAAFFALRRLRLLDDLPIAVDHNRLPLSFLPDALAIDFTVASLYASLEAAESPITRSELRIEARRASGEEATLLGLPVDVPVLVATERATGRDGVPITIGCTVYRSDRHRFLATFVRTERSGAVSALRSG